MQTSASIWCCSHMCLGITTWECLTCHLAHPRENWLSLSSQAWIAGSSSSRDRACAFTCPLVVSLGKPCFRNHVFETAWAPLSSHIQKTQQIPDPLALTILLSPLLQCSSRLRCRSCVTNVSNGTGLCPMICCSLHFDQLCIYVINAVSFSRKFLG